MRLPSSLLRTDSIYRTWGTEGTRLGVGFWCGEPSYCERDHVTTYWSFGLVLRGAADFCNVRLGPGAIYVRHPGICHDFAVLGTDYVECWLDLGGAMAGVPCSLGITDPQRPVQWPGLDVTLVRRWDALLKHAQRADALDLPPLGAEVLSLAADVMALKRRSGRDPHDKLITDACRILEAGADAARLARLATDNNLSLERLRKIFRARVGCPPGQYRVRCRMDRARALLRDHSLKVAEIADVVGCASVATFSLQFKQHTGTAPAIWRRGK